MSVLESILAAAMALATPDAMSSLAATLVGRPDLAGFLRTVAKLEARGKSPGLHERDARFGPDFHARAVAAGWLDPSRCPAHRDPHAGWSPRGPWGVAPAYSNRHFGWLGCFIPPAAHDSLPIAALAAALHARHCSRVKRTNDHRQLRLCWAGGGKRPEDVLARWDAAVRSGR